MTKLKTAVALFLSTLLDSESEFEVAFQRRIEVHEAAEAAEGEELADAARTLAEALSAGGLSLPRGGMAAITGGALVEVGAPAGPLGRAILARLPEVLAKAAVFQDACVAELPPLSEEDEDEEDEEDGHGHGHGHGHGEGEHDHAHEHGEGCEHDHAHDHEPLWIHEREVPLEVASRVAQRDMASASAYEALGDWCLPAIACLTREPALREEARGNPALYEQAEATLGYSHFLVMALDLLDDEPLLVLHPESARGFRARISGVADNFQLHTLLAGALVHEGGLPGKRPSEAALAIARGGEEQHGPPVSGAWNLYTWRALSPEGSLPGDPLQIPTERWIWNEGRPSDIEPFSAGEGPPIRVVLIGPAAYERSWNAGLVFGGLAASLDVEELSADEAQGWFARLAEGATAE